MQLVLKSLAGIVDKLRAYERRRQKRRADYQQQLLLRAIRNLA